MTPFYWPKMIAVAFLLLGLLLLFQSFFSKPSQKNKDAEEESLIKLLPILLLFLIYLFAWFYFGFLIPSILFVFAMMFVLKRATPIRLLVYSILLASFVYGGFFWGLRVPLD